MLVGNADVGMFGGFKANAVTYIGGAGTIANTYGSLGGTADSNLGTLCFWFRMESGSDGNLYSFPEASGSNFSAARNSSNTVEINLKNTTGTLEFFVETAGSYIFDGLWHHVAASWDTNHAAGAKIFNMYIDGVSDKSVVFDGSAAFNVNYTTTFQVCAAGTAANQSLAEIYFNPGVLIDFTVAANVQKFRSTSGKPVYLGSDGSLPTGSAPPLYLKDPAATCNVNSGTGGGPFTITGTPVNATVGP